MTPATETTGLSFDEYVAYDDGTENRYELVEGALIAMTPPALEHFLITKFLEQVLEGVPIHK